MNLTATSCEGFHEERNEQEKDEQRETGVGEAKEARPGIYSVSSGTIELPITSVAPAVAHWTPRPKKRPDVEGCRAESPRPRALA
jgi:hypothetical protein